MFEGITDLGRQYLAKCQANGSGIKLAKVKIGDGRIERNEDPSLFVDIKSIKKEIEISEKYQEGNNLRLIIEFNNDGVEKGYFPREIGIYAQDGEKEILYWYINDGEQVSWLPPSSKAPIKFKYGINITATNNESTIINWTGKELWVDREFLNKELVKKQNETENRLLTRAKKIWEAINELFNNKLEKGGYLGTAKNLNDEISKKATSTQLGRIIVGNGLTTDSRGMLSVAENASRRFVSDEEKRNWNGKLSQGYIPSSLNSAEKIFKALQGNVGIKFDEALLYLNDPGTKKAGYCYLDKLKDGIFECTSSTTTTVNNSSYFKNLSNKNNSDRLDNLFNLDNYNKGTIASEVDMNTLVKSGYYRWFAEAGYPLNLPNDRTSRGIIIVLTIYSHTLQIVYSFNGSRRSRVGVNNIFDEWK